MPRFPPGFRFGTSTAAYQIEGAVSSDGKGPSIWDTFTAKPGSIVDGSSGAQACDHYHRYAEDVALMGQLGSNAYRFSIAWPRIQPSGKGRPSPKGLAFYDRLIDELLEVGVNPMVTSAWSCGGKPSPTRSRWSSWQTIGPNRTWSAS